MFIAAIILSILEIVVTVSVVRYLGLPTTCLLYVVTSGLGLILWKVGRKPILKKMDEVGAIQTAIKKQHGEGDGATKIALENPEFRSKMGEISNYSFIIFLLFIPGLATTVLGYLLFLPFVRRSFNPIYGKPIRDSPESSQRTKKFK